MMNQGKGKFKITGKVCVVFTSPRLPSHHGCLGFKVATACISRRNPLIPEETKQIYLQIIVYICSNLSRGYLGLMQGAYLSFAYWELKW